MKSIYPRSNFTMTSDNRSIALAQTDEVKDYNTQITWYDNIEDSPYYIAPGELEDTFLQTNDDI